MSVTYDIAISPDIISDIEYQSVAGSTVPEFNAEDTFSNILLQNIFAIIIAWPIDCGPKVAVTHHTIWYIWNVRSQYGSIYNQKLQF